MRFSLYDMADYGLQHSEGTLHPFKVRSSDEAAWNLLWSSIPEVDAFLDLKPDDFPTYQALLQDYPFRRQYLVMRAGAATGALSMMDGATPAAAARILSGVSPEFRRILAGDFDEWAQAVHVRLGMAQSLIDTKEAAALCQAVVAVDFRAGKRL